MSTWTRVGGAALRPDLSEAGSGHAGAAAGRVNWMRPDARCGTAASPSATPFRCGTNRGRSRIVCLMVTIGSGGKTRLLDFDAARPTSSHWGAAAPRSDYGATGVLGRRHALRLHAVGWEAVRAGE